MASRAAPPTRGHRAVGPNWTGTSPKPFSGRLVWGRGSRERERDTERPGAGGAPTDTSSGSSRGLCPRQLGPHHANRRRDPCGETAINTNPPGGTHFQRPSFLLALEALLPPGRQSWGSVYPQPMEGAPRLPGPACPPPHALSVAAAGGAETPSQLRHCPAETLAGSLLPLEIRYKLLPGATAQVCRILHLEPGAWNGRERDSDRFPGSGSARNRGSTRPEMVREGGGRTRGKGRERSSSRGEGPARGLQAHTRCHSILAGKPRSLTPRTEPRSCPGDS